MDGLEGFRAFAKERLTKLHGMSQAKFPLCPNEKEFRYDHLKGEFLPDAGSKPLLYGAGSFLIALFSYFLILSSVSTEKNSYLS